MATPEAPQRTLLSVVQSWPQDAQSVPLARDALRTTLESWGMAYLADRASLVLSELMTNALQHASNLGAEIEVSYGASPDSVHLEVFDADADRWPRMRPASTTCDRGRGLQLVDAITDGRWGTQEHSGLGKVVWAYIGGGGE